MNSKDMEKQKIDRLEKGLTSLLFCKDYSNFLVHGNGKFSEAINEYYKTWEPHKYFPRTDQLFKAYNIRVVIGDDSASYDIEGLDEIRVDRMVPYHSIYGQKPALNSSQMQSVVEYIMDGSRPIPPHIHNSPYPSSYGPIRISIKQFNNVVV